MESERELIRELEDTKKALKKLCVQLQAELQTLEEERVQFELEHSHPKTHRLQRENEELRTAIEKMRNNPNQSTVSVDRLRAKVKDLSAALEYRTEDLDRIQESLHQKQRDVKRLEQDICDMECQLEGAMNQAAEQQPQERVADRTELSATPLSTERQQEIDDQKESCLQKISDLKRVIKHLQDEAEDCHDQMSKREMEYKKFMQQIEMLRKQLSEAKSSSRASQLAEENEALRKEIQARREGSGANSKEKLVQLVSRIGKMNDTLNERRCDLEDMEKSCKDAELKRKVLQDELHNLRMALDAAEGQ